MKKFISIIGIMLWAGFLHAQVGINTNSPAGVLDISSGDNGILIPRVSLISTIQESPVNNPKGGSLEDSTLVYNTASINDVEPGYYFWQDNRWISMAEPVGVPLVYKLAVITLPNETNENVDFELNGSNDDATLFRILQDEDGAEIGGISGGTHGRQIYIFNGESEDLLILSEDHSSSASANKFSLNGDVVLSLGGSIMLYYDGLYSNRWILVRSDN